MRYKRAKGSWGVSPHCLHRYKQRVTNDVELNEGRRKTKGIGKVIRQAMSRVDLSKADVIHDFYFCKVILGQGGKIYYLLVPVADPTHVTTLLTEEMYESSRQHSGLEGFVEQYE